MSPMSSPNSYFQNFLLPHTMCTAKFLVPMSSSVGRLFVEPPVQRVKNWKVNIYIWRIRKNLMLMGQFLVMDDVTMIISQVNILVLTPTTPVLTSVFTGVECVEE